MLGYILVATLHALVCVVLILVVLLQSGKGADLASAFGGASTQTVFGSRGPASFLSKMTTVAAIVFMLTSLGLSLMGSKQETKSIMDTEAAKAAPGTQSKPQSPAVTPEQLRQMQEELRRKAAQQAAAPPAGAAQQQAGTKPAEGAPPAKKQ